MGSTDRFGMRQAERDIDKCPSEGLYVKKIIDKTWHREKLLDMHHVFRPTADFHLI